MIRNVELTDISDGHLYHPDDVCKVDTCECKNCDSCCKGMDDTVILDPYDVYQLSSVLCCQPESLIGNKIELGMADALILPHLVFQKNTGKCVFLNEKGLCSIHTYRPGICRIFPLGRYYHDECHSYILQIHECAQPKVKSKVKKWIGYSNYKEYEKFVDQWHYFLRDVGDKIERDKPDDDSLRQWNLLILKLFYFKTYNHNSDSGNNGSESFFDQVFYRDFNDRVTYARDLFDISR